MMDDGPRVTDGPSVPATRTSRGFSPPLAFENEQSSFRFELFFRELFTCYGSFNFYGVGEWMIDSLKIELCEKNMFL